MPKQHLKSAYTNPSQKEFKSTLMRNTTFSYYQEEKR